MADVAEVYVRRINGCVDVLAAYRDLLRDWLEGQDDGRGGFVANRAELGQWAVHFAQTPSHPTLQISFVGPVAHWSLRLVGKPNAASGWRIFGYVTADSTRDLSDDAGTLLLTHDGPKFCGLLKESLGSTLRDLDFDADLGRMHPTYTRRAYAALVAGQAAPWRA